MGSALYPPSTRREFLLAGAALGIGLPELLGAPPGTLRGYDETAADELPPARAKGVIQVFLGGGIAHQETFDPKPYSPVTYRGQGRTVDTSLPGVRFGQYLTKTAAIADRLTVIRSFTHGEAAHERGTHNMLTGYRPSPAVVYPSLGSLVAHELGPRTQLPPYICVPNAPGAYAGAGYLPSSFAPFSLGSDPQRKNFKVRDLDLPKGVDDARFQRRRKMLERVNERFDAEQEADALAAMDTFYERAYELLSSPEAKEAFRIDAEDNGLRDRYGRTSAGQRMLLARRLVEHGARWVTVQIGGWDMHEKIFDRMKKTLPPVDQAFAALVEDMDSRGLLDETLVLWTSEFGRSPKINQRGGRDHWPGVFSVAMAGGGVKRGMVYGASDATASVVDEKAVTPEDLARTVFTLVGVDPDKTLYAGGSRPLQVVRGGRLVRDILA